MGTQLAHKLKQILRRLWVRAAIISVLGILSAALAPVIAPLIPSGLLGKVKEDTVRSLLDILANSMLTVTTFSLTVMVTTHLTASQQVTPRVHRLLRGDTRTQTVLATFIGAFVFALTSIVILQLDFIEESAFGVLYAMTLLVISLVIVAILRWVDHLASLGSIEDSTSKVEAQVLASLETRLASPYLGGHPATDLPENGSEVVSDKAGFVQHIDTSQISEHIAKTGTKFHVVATSGDWVGEGDTLGILDTDQMDEEMEQHLRDAFTVGPMQSFDQDAVFGMTVMTEIAERALSPGINDPQTALDIVSRLTSLFERLPEEEIIDDPEAPGVYVPALNVGKAVAMAFTPIARDGKTYVEVQLRVQSALARLSRSSNEPLSEAARQASAHALAYAEHGLLLADDLERVRKVAIADKAAETASVV